jgi:hypothetical protein
MGWERGYTTLSIERVWRSSSLIMHRSIAVGDAAYEDGDQSCLECFGGIHCYVEVGSTPYALVC